MGIKGLTTLIGDNCPEAMLENPVKNYFGRKIAIDASMALYAFLIAVRPELGMWLTNDSGETTSHLMGMWSRTIRLINYGIKPVFVFDGRPPEMKSEELQRRAARKKEAQTDLDAAKESGDAEAQRKLEKRTVHVTQKHSEESKELLKLMGVPIVEAPCEAEAQCASMCNAGLVFATGTEDMDSLTFGTSILLRHLNYSEAQKKPILEIHLNKVLEGFGLSMESFIDLCILCGCDYCGTIRGIGPKRALDLIQKYKTIEEALKHLDRAKYPLPENFNYVAAREMFKSPDLLPPSQIDLQWNEPDEEGLLKYLVGEKGFSEERVKKGIEKLKRARGSTVQGRLDTFFTKQVRESPVEKPSPASKKQLRGKAAATSANNNNNNGKGPRRGVAKVLPTFSTSQTFSTSSQEIESSLSSSSSSSSSQEKTTILTSSPKKEVSSPTPTGKINKKPLSSSSSLASTKAKLNFFSKFQPKEEPSSKKRKRIIKDEEDEEEEDEDEDEDNNNNNNKQRQNKKIKQEINEQDQEEKENNQSSDITANKM